MKDSVAMLQAMDIASTVGQVIWSVDDNLCDCVFQRVGYWSNPYLGETLEVRFCCIWEDLYKQYPQFVRRTYQTPEAWDSKEGDMPRAIWYRQLAAQERKTLETIRQERHWQEPPKAIKD